jgi:hypothetical protein
MQALLYLGGREDAQEWNGQYFRAVPPHQRGIPTDGDATLGGDFLPNFGHFAAQKADLLAPLYETGSVAQSQPPAGPVAAAPRSSPPSINSLIASATDKIGAWHELSQASP